MDPRGKSTRPGLPNTGVSHSRVHLAGLKHDLHRLDHKRVPAEPKYSPIQKKPIFRALRHSKAYLNT
ncbi:Ganglioside-induced differentiation-associated protein 1-like 1 [Gossypium arboreum]|uniref:Ganglioside-induced differentiation-associated protein 1-like 1 n=1 Tax=Gossypium arboreum TaxID=29729 RepID=A0A0B0MG39_GOSAR|nr:Ganglioside-induced differentiation-associated protein 1-like 1 [Gossypium arboreum]